MDAKKCDRCGRFYETGNRPNAIQIGTIGGFTGLFLDAKSFDLCPLCMDELNEFLTDPNAFQCLGNCNECENYDDCEALEQAKEIEEYEGKVFKELYEEKTDEQI